MSVTKMLSRIVAPEEVLSANEEDDNVIHKNLHDHTYVAELEQLRKNTKKR